MKAWKPRANLGISSWSDNVFMFQFEKADDRQRVLQEAPWSVMGSLLVLQPLLLGKAVEDMEFKWSPFWVQVHGISVAKMTRQNGEIIGRRIGNLIGVEALHDGLLLNRSFLILRVDVDVTQPLPLGFILHQLGHKEEESWISYCYEKLSDFCYDCGRIGHDKSSCKFVSRAEGQKSGFGPELRTMRAPMLNIPLKEVHHWVNKAEEWVHNLVGNRPLPEWREEACTVPPKDNTNIPTPEEVGNEDQADVLRQIVVSETERDSGPSGTSSPQAEVAGVRVNITNLKENPVPVGQTEATRSNPSGPALIPLAQSLGGPRPSYFVTEPLDNPSIVRPSPSCGSGIGPLHEIGIEEISPSSSPTSLSFLDQALDKSMAICFQDLSIKRKAQDEIGEESQPKRLKQALVNADRKIVVALNRKGKPHRTENGHLIQERDELGKARTRF
ncbi:hypothetical protein ACSBR1_023845 [Camellia fascicularis]